ncbi:hypothetical protein Pst134EB_001555 [Puccinia striiformis f. sp. tritici]|nr:hypothetical protein Pst134EB_001555 [Puccinia striiformis f. sp. tritici]
MKISAFLVCLPILVSSGHINNPARLEGENESSGSKESTKAQVRQPNDARSTGMANLHTTSLTKLSPSDTAEAPKNLKFLDKAQDSEAALHQSSQAGMIMSKRNSTKSAGSKSSTRRHISDNKAFESFLIQKRDKAIPSKNLLKAFLDDTKPGTNATSGQGPPNLNQCKRSKVLKNQPIENPRQNLPPEQDRSSLMLISCF